MNLPAPAAHGPAAGAAIKILPLRIHHLSCGSFRPPFALLVDGRGGLFRRARYVVHCLLLELETGLLLVDSGLSAEDMADPARGLGPVMALFGGASPAATAAKQVEELGVDRADVRHILLTHLDRDHAGGLSAFPNATVHAHPAEIAAAQARRTFMDRQRYNPAHFAHGPRWQPLDLREQDLWQGLPVLKSAGLPDSIRFLPLPGHSAGHCGIAVYDGQHWLLHCGDAVYHRAWLDGRRPTILLQAVEALLQHNATERARSCRLLRELVIGGSVSVFCAHDLQAYVELGGSL